jgi:hypothetical protein
MRVSVRLLVFFVLCVGVLPARAGVSVSSYDTQVQANAYAPVDQSAYYADNSKHNTSPASGDINADWSGTNVGGSDTTWHMTALVHTESTTTFGPSFLSITGAGSFSYNITTTAGFSEPLQHATLFVPGANSGVGSVFSIDQPEVYSISVTLGRDSDVLLSSPSGIVFDQGNSSSIPKVVATTGMIGPGQYQIGAGTNQHGPSGLPNGVNHVSVNGSFSNFTFTLQVPEPAGMFVFIVGYGVSRRRSRLHPQQKRR